MANVTHRADGWTGSLRWAARAVGLAAAVLFAWFLVDRGPEVVPLLSWSEPRGMPLLLVLMGAVIGAVLAWRWEFAGGVLAVAGGLGILGLVAFGGGTGVVLGALFFVTPLLLAGVLYLFCRIRGGR